MCAQLGIQLLFQSSSSSFVVVVQTVISMGKNIRLKGKVYPRDGSLWRVKVTKILTSGVANDGSRFEATEEYISDKGFETLRAALIYVHTLKQEENSENSQFDVIDSPMSCM